MFFADFSGLLRVLVVGVLAYAAMVFLLRISGKRTLSKMNAFDLIITVALGSTLSTVIMSKDVALAEGGVAIALLIGLQFVLTWLSVRSGAIESLVKAKPRLVFFRGEFLRAEMLRERITRSEILAAMRNQGSAVLNEVGAVILETDGSLTVIGCTEEGGMTTLPDQPPNSMRSPSRYCPRNERINAPPPAPATARHDLILHPATCPSANPSRRQPLG